jgi:hypothetical protein
MRELHIFSVKTGMLPLGLKRFKSLTERFAKLKQVQNKEEKK